MWLFLVIWLNKVQILMYFERQNFAYVYWRRQHIRKNVYFRRKANVHCPIKKDEPVRKWKIQMGPLHYYQEMLQFMDVCNKIEFVETALCIISEQSVSWPQLLQLSCFPRYLKVRFDSAQNWLYKVNWYNFLFKVRRIVSNRM